jgi:hypothetical protein
MIQLSELSKPIDDSLVGTIAVAKPDERVALLKRCGVEVNLLGHRADLQTFDSKSQSLLLHGKPLTDKERAATDWQLAGTLHEALRDLPRRELLKPRFWEWLSLVALPEYVVARWVEDRDSFTVANCGRFSCSAGVAGIETNALARLYWTADVSWSVRGDYSGLDSLLRIQDLHKTIFTNQLCYQGRLCLAHADEMKQNFDEDEAREMVKILGKIQASTAYVGLTDQQLVDLIKQLRPLLPKKSA